VFLTLSRGRDLMARGIDRAERRTGELHASLRALSPASTLARGYAIAQQADGSIVRDAASAPDGATLTITLDEGAITATSHGTAVSAHAPSRK
jgi:exodeoxyribonuclease VII large subunit